MKLAEALIIRAQLKNKLYQLSNRLNLNCKYQEGEKPDEDPLELLKQIDFVNDELRSYIVAINNTNCQVIVNGVSLMQIIAERDALTKKVEILQGLNESAANRFSRSTKTEIKIFSSVSIPEIQREIDSLSKKIRLLDTMLQEYNWTTELIK